MIKYEGIKVENHIGYLILSNSKENKISIPISEEDARRISLYLEKFALVNPELVEPSERSSSKE